MLKWIVLALVAGFGTACSAVVMFGERVVFDMMVRPILATPWWQLAGWSLLGIAIDVAISIAVTRLVIQVVRAGRR